MLLSQITSTINTVKFHLIKFVIDFEMEDIVTSAHWYWKVEDNFLQSFLIFCYFLWLQKINKLLLKAFLTRTFIHSLLNSFNLPSYSWKSRKRCALWLLCCWCVWKCWQKGFSVFLGMIGKGFVENYETCQMFSMWNIDQNLNIALLIVSICTVLF